MKMRGNRRCRAQAVSSPTIIAARAGSCAPSCWQKSAPSVPRQSHGRVRDGGALEYEQIGYRGAGKLL
jgi:hypothetical protein